MFPAPVVPYIREADYAVRQPWYTPPRRLLDYLLLFVQEGECLAEVEGRDYLLRRGDICFIQPDTLHSLRGRTNTVTPYIHFDLFYNPRREEGFPTRGGQVSLADLDHLLQPRLDDLGWIDVPVQLEPPHPPHVHSTILRMVEEWQAGDELSRIEANHLACGLMLTIFRQYGATPMTLARGRHSLNWVPSYLSFQIGEPLTVADMAKRANLSPSRFSHLFRQRYGIAPHQYFLRLRVAHAQELLRGTDLTLREIAESCGFADVHHFSKAFKRVTGITPGAFRLT